MIRLSIPFRTSRWAVLLTVMGLMSVAISSNGFWIDEITTGLLARAGTWSEFVGFLGQTGSEMQMPLFSVYAWGWGRLFGTSELALRLMNLPWALLALLSFESLLRRQGLSRAALFLLLLPFIGNAMNEARPYMMTLAGSFMLLESWTAGLTADEPRISFWIRIRILGGMGLTLGASLLNVFILPTLLALSWALNHRNRLSIPFWERMRHEWKFLAGMAGVLGALGLFYAGTLFFGYGGQKQALTVINLGYALYEWVGFSGWGPPRHLFRESAFQCSLWKPFLPGLILVAISWFCVGVRCLRVDRTRRSWIGIWWGSAGIGILCLIGAAALAPASLWGRHFMVFYPYFLLGLAEVLAPFGASWKTGWLLALVVGLGWVGSLRQRILPIYGKDPYREVRDVLNTQAALPVYWVAAPWAPDYYLLQPTHRLELGVGWSKDRIRAMIRDQPQFWVVIHRPDKFDPSGAWTSLMTSGKTVWEQRGMKLVWIESLDIP